MRIIYGKDEKPSNFCVAEAIVNLCNEGWGIDAEAIAKMILVQVEANKEKSNG